MNITDVVFILGISWLAVYAKSRLLYVGTVFCLVLFGYKYAITTDWLYSIPMYILAAWMAFKAIWGR